MTAGLLLLVAAAFATAAPDYVRIPAGSFEMGCVADDPDCEPAEGPRHRVTLTRSYDLARTETSVAQFRRFVVATGYRTLAEQQGRGRYWRADLGDWDWIRGLSWAAPFEPYEAAPGDWPAVQIAWADADAYCRWTGGRLPTEAEWERAARGGTDGRRHVWGDAKIPIVDGRAQANGPDAATARLLPSFAHFAGYADGFARVAPVARFPSNAYGLHDMAGNAYEWTADWNDDRPYAPGAATDPTGPANGTAKALRGGGWGYPPAHFRVSWRGLAGLDFWTATFGFRCARDVR